MATKANSKSAAGAGDGGDEGGDAPLLDLNEASVKKLLSRAKKRGYITYDELNAVLPSDEFSPEVIDNAIAALASSDINVVEEETPVDPADRPEEIPT